MRDSNTHWSRRSFLRNVLLSSLPVTVGCRSSETAAVRSLKKESVPSAPPPARSSAAADPTAPTQEEPLPGPPPEQDLAPSPPKVIYLAALGPDFEAEAMKDIEAALKLYFPAKVQLLPPSPLPAAAYYKPRSRYRAEKLLDYLESITPEDAQVVVGLTSVDISTTKGQVADWGILGLATISGRQCVISEFRARRGAKDAVHVRERLMKTVVHEVGHTIGLEHCPNYGCIMEDGKGTVTTTDHELDICSDCRKKAGPKLLAPPERFPWASP